MTAAGWALVATIAAVLVHRLAELWVDASPLYAILAGSMLVALTVACAIGVRRL